MKKIISFINAENEHSNVVHELAQEYENRGADMLFIYNRSTVESEREEFLCTIRQLVREVDIPVMVGIDAKGFEDIKKAFYTGANSVVVRYKAIKKYREEQEAATNTRGMAALAQAAKRFGADKILLEVDESDENADDFFEKYPSAEAVKELGVGGLLIKHVEVSKKLKEKIAALDIPVYIRDGLIRNDMETLLKIDGVEGVATNFYGIEQDGTRKKPVKDILKVKRELKKDGVEVETYEGSVDFSKLKTDAAGLVPVVVQDYKTSEVLMLAYMNQQAYEETLKTGMMTYFSRSRQQLWVKGETSGHFQYLKSLEVDCDKDTLLAKVRQVGVACHTGNPTCFYTNVSRRPHEERNPYEILSELYEVVLDRKKNPREGSYTNYLFEKGIDKILKKCGEEACEIIIAAKNPQAEELKYEIADYLYHLTVLMAQCGVDWEDVALELAHRH